MWTSAYNSRYHVHKVSLKEILYYSLTRPRAIGSQRDTTIQTPHCAGHLTLVPRNNSVESKAALFAGLQTARTPQGH